MDHAGIRVRPLTIESRWTLVVLVIAAGAVACEPTTMDRLHTAVALVDVTHAALPLQIFRAQGQLDCATVAQAPEIILEAGDFLIDSCPTLQPFKPAPLDIGAYEETYDAYGDELSPPAGATRDCEAVVVRTPGFADTAFFWTGVAQADIDLDDDLDFDSPNLGFMNAAGSHWLLVPPPVARAWAPDFVLPADDCESAP